MSQLSKLLEYLYCNYISLLNTTQKSNEFYCRYWNGATETYPAKLMKTNSQTFYIFSKFIYQADSQSRNKLKNLCTNFGGRFVNKASEELTANESVKWELGASYTLEQNVRDERLN